MPRTNRVACQCRAATVSEAHTSLNSKHHPLKRPRVGLGSQKRQSSPERKTETSKTQHWFLFQDSRGASLILRVASVTLDSPSMGQPQS